MKDIGRYNDEIELFWDGYDYIVPQEAPPVVRAAESAAANC